MTRGMNILSENAIYKHFHGNGEAAHFYSANGFPTGVYSPLLLRLSKDYNVSSLEYRATWPEIGLPPGNLDWRTYADDLIAFIEQQYQVPVIGIGHSMGATCTILAAEKRPDLFSKLVLIEPAMVSRLLAVVVRLLPKSITNRLDPIKGTLRRQDFWESRESFLVYCKKVRGYRKFNEESFQAMAQHGATVTHDKHVRLAFPKEWEAHNYARPLNVFTQLKKLKIPTLAIRGKSSIFFSETMWQHWRRLCPNTIFKENLSYGHLLPLETPSICFEMIVDGLSALGRHNIA